MTGPAHGGAVQVRGEVASVKPAGDYLHLTMIAPGVPQRMRPGNFVALSVGGDRSSMLLRRAFSIYRANPNLRGGTVEIVFAEHGAGTGWMTRLAPKDPIDVVGPLGRPFALPKEPVACTLVGGGYGMAPMFSLADRLRERGCSVHMLIGAASESRLFGALEAGRAASSVRITTEDGSMGHRGRVTDVLPDLIDKTGSDVVYACGPMPMLRAVSQIADEKGAHSQCAVEESMACGVGVCMTCVLPVRGDDGVVRMVRSCVEGPVFRGERVLWDDVGTIPEGTLGAASRVARDERSDERDHRFGAPR